MFVGFRCRLVRFLSMFVSRRRVMLRFVMFAMRMSVRCLVVMMSRSSMMSGSSVVMLI